MTSGFGLALVAAGVVALVDWWAVWAHRPNIELAAKPLTILLLILGAFASTLDGTRLALVVTALAFSLLGDMLLLPRFDNFLGGLGSFLIGHLAYLGAIATLRPAVPVVLLVAGAMALSVAPVVRQMSDGPLTAIRSYSAALCLLVGLATGSGGVALIGGAVLFSASDGVLAWNRFVAPIPRGRVYTHVLYHLGQALLVLGISIA